MLLSPFTFPWIEPAQAHQDDSVTIAAHLQRLSRPGRQTDFDRIAAYGTVLNQPLTGIIGLGFDGIEFAAVRAGETKCVSQHEPITASAILNHLPSAAIRSRKFAQRRESLLAVNCNREVAVAVDGAAIHACGVERHGDISLSIQRDDATFGANLDQNLMNHLIGALFQALAGQTHPGTDFMRHDMADEEFPVAGGRDRAAPVVGPGSGTDDR